MEGKKKMVESISKSIHKARKEYYDDGWDWLDIFISERNYDGLKIPFNLLRTLAEAKNNHSWACRISPGQTYECQFNKQEGEVFYFRTKIEFLPFFKYGVFSMD